MAETQTCQQCGRTGTRGFHSMPTEDVKINGRVVVAAMSITECTGAAACRRRRRKSSGGAAGHAARMRAYE